MQLQSQTSNFFFSTENNYSQQRINYSKLFWVLNYIRVAAYITWRWQDIHMRNCFRKYNVVTYQERNSRRQTADAPVWKRNPTRQVVGSCDVQACIFKNAFDGDISGCAATLIDNVISLVNERDRIDRYNAIIYYSSSSHVSQP